MKTCALGISAVGISALLLVTARAQSPSPGENADPSRLDALTKKVDDVNTKIDALSQQILKIEQQLSSISRPGVMIGEPTPPPTAPVAADSKVSPPPQNGNSHTIAKGETLTSIAKMHKVTVDELQKFNHIENDRKLQVGQTIMIPMPSASPSASISAPPTTP
jgi:LysM repeat protein